MVKILTPADVLNAEFAKAKPGDRFLLRGGTYAQPFTLTKAGTSWAPIRVQPYEHEPVCLIPVANPSQPTSNDAVFVKPTAVYNEIRGFEIRGGWHGVEIEAPYTKVEYLHVHDNANQGVLIVSAHNVAVFDSTIERNGLTHPSPWHQHGVYLSDYYGRGLRDIAVQRCVIRQHGGAAVHVYPGSPLRATNVYVLDNVISENAIDVILISADNVLVQGNTIRHLGYPATNAPRTAMFWIELCRRVTVQNNPELRWGIEAPTIPADLVYEQSQNIAETTFAGNTWVMPDGWPVVTDDMLLAA